MSRPEQQVTMDTSEMNVLFVHSAIDDYPLTPEEFHLYAHPARRASSGAAYPSVSSMAKACRMHPDTVRHCLRNLLAYKMLEAHERKGKTTLYTLTRFSGWVKPQVVLALQEKQAAEGKARRAEKKARKQQTVADPSKTKEGVEEGEDALTPRNKGRGTPLKRREGTLPKRRETKVIP